jgi:hypothetical protein
MNSYFLVIYHNVKVDAVVSVRGLTEEGNTLSAPQNLGVKWEAAGTAGELGPMIQAQFCGGQYMTHTAGKIPTSVINKWYNISDVIQSTYRKQNHVLKKNISNALVISFQMCIATTLPRAQIIDI